MPELYGALKGNGELDAARREAMEFAGIGLYRFRFDGVVLFMDKGALRIFDLESLYPEPAMVAGKLFSELVHYLGPEGQMREEVRGKGHIHGREWHYQTLTGKHRWVIEDCYLVRDSDHKNEFIQVLLRDISEQKEAEKALREAETRYQELFENANDIVYTHDLTGRFTSINKAGEIISGYSREEALDMNAIDIIAPPFRDQTREMLESKLHGEETTRYESAIITKDDRTIPLEVSTRLIFDDDGQPIGIQGIARDISERVAAESERKRLEAQLRHTQKLESLGVLAGGIAHDFNNLLVGILGNAGLALKRLPKETPERIYLQRIEATAQRAAELTNQMLAYSGRGVFRVEPVNMSELAQEIGQLIQASISKKAVLRYECTEDLPLIEGDVTQLHQVLINLITNASDAIGDESGIITVRTGVTEVSKAYLAGTYVNNGLCEGPYVYLEVSDTGHGMDTETQARLFDPFFSTKFTGRGLGLAVVLGIVRGHHGAITLTSETGKGSTFRVLFPVAAGLAKEDLAQSPLRDKKALAWRHSGLILVADDEETVRDVAREMLEDHGLRVMVARDGKEALDLFSQHANEIDAVLLDLTMPVMNGQEVLEYIHALRPKTPVILSSGYTEKDISDRFRGFHPTAFIQKPYLPDELEETVYKILVQQ